LSTNIKISSGTEWERKVSYSRAVRAGNQVFISGTTAVDKNGNVLGKGDVHEQTRQCLLKIEKALEEAGGMREHIVRTRTFITNIKDWEAFGKAHGAFFEGINPAATLVEVQALIAPELLVEIEADAIIPDE
jgi:enamine deaminase RidA (YjgF/YER057c/UK114 family)